MVIGFNGVERPFNWYVANGVNGLVFKGIDGTNYGSYGFYGGTSGTFWETDIPSGCSVQYISGRSGVFLDAISFHHNCLPNTNLSTTTTEGMNTDMHNSWFYKKNCSKYQNKAELKNLDDFEVF